MHCAAVSGRYALARILHDWRDSDTHNCQSSNQFPANHRNRGQQELFPLFVLFRKDGMTMIEGVEELGELKDMLGEKGGLSCGDALVNDRAGLRASEPELPDFVVFMSI